MVKLVNISESKRRQLYRAKDLVDQARPIVRELKARVEKLDKHFRHTKGRVKETAK